MGKKKKKTKGPDAASKLPMGKHPACPAELWTVHSLGSTDRALLSLGSASGGHQHNAKCNFISNSHLRSPLQIKIIVLQDAAHEFPGKREKN